MNALKPKHQRLVLVVVALIALVAAGLLAAYALRSQASYFYLPEQMRDDPPAIGQAVRLGGMVEQGSLATDADGFTLRFMVTGSDGARVPVRFAGIAPDLFVEGSGVVAEGRLDVLIFFVDPLSPQPHDVDVKALIRMATLANIPFACNPATADLIVARQPS